MAKSISNLKGYFNPFTQKFHCRCLENITFPFLAKYAVALKNASFFPCFLVNSYVRHIPSTVTIFTSINVQKAFGKFLLCHLLGAE